MTGLIRKRGSQGRACRVRCPQRSQSKFISFCAETAHATARRDFKLWLGNPEHSLLRFKKVGRHWSVGAQLLQLFCSCSQCKTAVIASGLPLCLLPVTVRAPMSRAPVESLGTKGAEPRSVEAIGRANNHANYWRPRIEDRSRRWWRVIVRRPGSAVRLNHFGAGIRAPNRCKAQCEHDTCYHR
jgi:hypothetical protein